MIKQKKASGFSEAFFVFTISICYKFLGIQSPHQEEISVSFKTPL